MIGRRGVIVGTGALVLAGGGAYAAERTGVLDDALRSTGLDPVPQPDPADERLLQDARTALTAVLLVAQRDGAEDVATLVSEQVDALGGPDTAASQEPAPPLRTALQDAADEIGAASLRATAPALAQVLASASAGLLQARSAR